MAGILAVVGILAVGNLAAEPSDGRTQMGELAYEEPVACPSVAAFPFVAAFAVASCLARHGRNRAALVGTQMAAFCGCSSLGMVAVVAVAVVVAAAAVPEQQ